MKRIRRPRSIRADSSSARAGCAVAPAPARLLVVRLEARRQRPVRDRAHVSLVDAHAERVRRHHHLRAALHERTLALAPRVRAHARVVGHRRDPLLPRSAQRPRQCPCACRSTRSPAAPRGRSSDCISAARLRATAPLPSTLTTSKVEVRPVEARADRHPVAQPQPRCDLLAPPAASPSPSPPSPPDARPPRDRA